MDTGNLSLPHDGCWNMFVFSRMCFFSFVRTCYNCVSSLCLRRVWRCLFDFTMGLRRCLRMWRLWCWDGEDLNFFLGMVYSYGHLLVITGYFYGIKYMTYKWGFLFVLPTGITWAITAIISEDSEVHWCYNIQ